jgi:hypothetical protein
MTDDAMSLPQNEPHELFNKTEGFGSDEIWEKHWELIQRANIFLDVANDVEISNDEDAKERDGYVAEVRTLRALAFFNLVRLFDRIPKLDFRVLDPVEGTKIGVVSDDEIYRDIIIPDLEFGIEYAKTKDEYDESNKGRITKAAAATLLGKVYLTLEDFASAESTLQPIVNGVYGNYNLVSYEQLYRRGELESTPLNDESILEILYSQEKSSNWNRVLPWELRGELNINDGGGYFYVTLESGGILEQYASEGYGPRFIANIDTSLVQKAPPGQERDYHYVYKYIRPNATGGVAQSTNFYVLRYADVLLMLAEANLRQNDATAALPLVNQVRNRAELAPLTIAELNMNRLLAERRMELAYEGHRWFDLVRLDIVDETVGEYLRNAGLRTGAIEPHQEYMPVPRQERERNASIPAGEGY